MMEPWAKGMWVYRGRRKGGKPVYRWVYRNRPIIASLLHLHGIRHTK